MVVLDAMKERGWGLRGVSIHKSCSGSQGHHFRHMSKNSHNASEFSHVVDVS